MLPLPFFPTLILYLNFIAVISASPIAWPDAKLEEINALRARGVSEVSEYEIEYHKYLIS